MKRRLAIVHYPPLSYYPPAINLLHDLEAEKDLEVRIYSQHARFNERKFHLSAARAVYVGRENNAKNSIISFLHFLLFHVKVFWMLLQYRPRFILYYENLSAISVAIYKLFFPGVRVMAHYHEYFEKSGSRRISRSQKFSFFVERKLLFRHLDWISHTNQPRLEMFLSDHNLKKQQNIQGVLPNYPPAAWAKKNGNRTRHSKLRLVYIGSLSCRDFYFREMVEWIVRHKDAVELDIYSYYLKEDVSELLDRLQTDNIRIFKKGVFYFDIPEVLKDYDVGLVLYRPLNLNMKYNETNKLFEYLICGLDVIYPREMEMISAHASNFRGRLHAVDFNALDELAVSRFTEKQQQVDTYPLEFTKETSSGRIISAIRRLDHP